MALTLALMNVKCASVGAPVPYIAIHGTGMDYRDLTLTRDGIPTTFLVGYVSPYIIHTFNFNPPFQSGVWCAKMRDVEYCTQLQCPLLDLSGIYYIDPERLHLQDFYNAAIKKIPDPTIRTALIGE
jgi:hypothetical protein